MNSSRTGRWPLWPTLLVVFFTVLMLWLGFWQLQRAEEKRQLLQWLESGVEIPVDSPADVLALPRYSFVTVTGHYLPRPQFLLENKVRNKRVGYEVFTPFAVDGWDRVILVNRGWLDAAVYRPEMLAITAAPQRIRARVDKPPKTGIELGEVSLDPKAAIQKMVYFSPDKLAQLFSASGHSLPLLQERVFLLDDAAGHGFARDWKPVIMPPSRHIGYAVQWFGLTLTLWLLYFFWLRKGRQTREKSNP